MFPWVDSVRKESREEGLQQGRQEGLERGLERGLEQGLERGLERGRQKERLTSTLELLQGRFGASEDKWRPRLEGWSYEELRKFTQRILDASSEEELEQ